MSAAGAGLWPQRTRVTTCGVYPNLAREYEDPAAINELWIAVGDITYIRLRCEFVYLAVVLDAYSRRVIGWALGRTLEAALAVSALRMAIDRAANLASLPGASLRSRRAVRVVLIIT